MKRLRRLENQMSGYMERPRRWARGARCALQGCFGSVGTALRALCFGYAFFLALVYYSYFTMPGVADASKMDLLVFPILPAVVASCLYPRLLRWCQSAMSAGKMTREGETFYFATCAASLFLAWMPVFLAYYPGLFTYDAYDQLLQILTNAYSAHHPLLHTWLFGVFYRLGEFLGNFTLGMALYTLMQMLALAISIAYMLLFLRELGWNKALRMAVLAFFALMPFVSVLAVSMTKDVLFCAAFAALFVHLCRGLCIDGLLRSRAYGITLTVLAVLVGLLRNNGVFALAFLLLAAIIAAVLKKTGWRLALLTACSLLLTLACSRALIGGFHARGASMNEALSVPYQQIAAVYHSYGDSLCEEEQEAVEHFIPDVRDYYPTIADMVKGTARAAEDLPGFISLYVRLLRSYPQTYVRAALEVTQGYWALGDTTHASMYGYGLEKRLGYLSTNMVGDSGIEHHTYLAPLESLYERLFSANEYLLIPFFRYLFSPALYIWLIALCLMFAFELKSGRTALPAALLLGLIATILAGPCCLIRYALPYIVCVPALWGIVFYRPVLAR